MRNIVVNAAAGFRIVAPAAMAVRPAPQDQRNRSMSPNNKNNTGGTRGRAALTFGDAARASEMRVLANGFAMLVVTVALLMMSAPELWPQLFAR